MNRPAVGRRTVRFGKGQTLVEVTIAMLLIALVSVGVFQVVLSARGRGQASESKEYVAQCSNTLLQQLKSYVAADVSNALVPNGGNFKYDTCPGNCWALDATQNHILTAAYLTDFCPMVQKIDPNATIRYTVTDQPTPGCPIDPTCKCNDATCSKSISVKIDWTSPKL